MAMTLLLVALSWTLLHSRCQCNTLNSVDLETPDSMKTWVITRSSPCSTTCGLGLRIQELCPLEADKVSGTGCQVRQVQCLDSWQCGLQTQTAAVGQRLELGCLEEVMETMGLFAFVVTWRYARGIITTDDSLFVRYDVPGLDKVVLDPVKEKDAGTYRCDVQDTSYHRVKRMYKGVKVLSPHVFSLDFTQGLRQWEKPHSLWPNVTLVTGKLYPTSTVLKTVLVSLAISFSIAVITFLGLLTFSYWKKKSKSSTTSPKPLENQL
ncbi:transmembrane protein 81 [Astyanax mexicanus]|uniref:Transmembrane protein 81 n=1 Tax=Astyanax mexicanus TaxID=7994 RepID=A0A8T2LGX8_ASTMX|nr:transmembrane protein 81 [Astyanax mexicanus]XP_049342132.1 transmembrane protein 81 [Astyanax mexicanus]XP_049342133.1 transmembrane protein 81 [Astyanax mexicanus]KAG9270790.1 transmembrane protein 81 [Astyanax mexicanus]